MPRTIDSTLIFAGAIGALQSGAANTMPILEDRSGVMIGAPKLPEGAAPITAS